MSAGSPTQQKPILFINYRQRVLTRQAASARGSNVVPMDRYGQTTTKNYALLWIVC